MRVSHKLHFAAALLLGILPLRLGAAHVVQHNLVSDISGLADFTDPNLVNPWGLVSGPVTAWWVNANGTGVSKVFDAQGQPFPAGSPLVVTIPLPPGATGTSAPTGIVFNSASGFEVQPGQPAAFIFVTENGTISAWNPAVDPANAILKVDNSPSMAIYKGAAIGRQGSDDRLYVANFHSGAVEVYDTQFQFVPFPAGAFMDPELPPGFAPFNVQNLDGRLFVSFAMQDEDKEDDVAGPGLGYVDVFDTSGQLMMRLQHGKWMNAPWGMVHATAGSGPFKNRILVGQFGSGEIARFNSITGAFEGLLRGPRGRPVSIEGLWGLSFGNGNVAGPADTLFFTAGILDEGHGLFGTLTAAMMPAGDDEDDQAEGDDTNQD